MEVQDECRYLQLEVPALFCQLREVDIICS
jgi:hypothetical protein